MATGNNSYGNQGAVPKTLTTKRVILIIVAALIILAVVWIVKESQQNNSDVPPSGTVGEVVVEMHNALYS